jgi:hypothetical protein
MILSSDHRIEVAYTPETISLQHRGVTHNLVNLPQWSGMKDVVPSVYLPRNQGASIWIILDLPLQQWYNQSASPDQGLPVIIERHPLPASAIEGENKQESEGCGYRRIKAKVGL